MLGSLRRSLHREGRVMTMVLVLEDQWTLRLGSAYSPTTGASSDERQAFLRRNDAVFGGQRAAREYC